MADRNRRARFDAAAFHERMHAARVAIGQALRAVDNCSDLDQLPDDVDALICNAGNAITCARVVLDVADARARGGRRG